MADEFKQFKNTRTGQVLSLSSQDLAGTYASIPTNPEYQPLTQQASTQPSTNGQQAQGQTLPAGQATAPADLISQFRGIDKSGNQKGLAENALSQVQSVTSLDDLLARAKPAGSEIGLLEQGQVYENRDPLAGGAATYNVVDNVRVTPDGFRIVDIKTVIPGQSSFPSGQLVQAPNGSFVSKTDAGGFKNITNLKDASFTTDAEADLGFAKQFGQVLESKKQDGTTEFYVHGTGQTFSTRAAAEAAARASDPFGVLSGTLSTPEARRAFQGDLRQQLGGQQSQTSAENNVPPGSQESYVQSPASIPFKSGLSDAQQSSIQNLIKARPVSEWNETDIKNWKYATNNAPLPGEAQVDVAQSLGESVVSGRPLTGPEFEAARKKFGVSEANFDKFFVRKGKDIFLKDSAENIVKEAITGEPTTSSINIDIPSEISSDVFSETVSDSAIQALIDEQKVFRAKILEALKPSEKELSLQEELGQIRNQINAKLASAEQGILDIQGQPIPMPLLTGQAAALQRQANADLTVLQRQEANLLESLGLERELDDRKLEAAKTGLSFVKDDINLQFKIQDRIQAQQDRLFERSQALDNKARQDLAMMLDMTKGFYWEDLDAETQQRMSALASKSNIPIGLLSQSIDHVKNELLAANKTTGDFQYVEDDDGNKFAFDKKTGTMTPFSELTQPASPNKKVDTALGTGVITGYGSPAWKWGLDLQLDGLDSAEIRLPFDAEIVDVVNTCEVGDATCNGGFGNQVKVKRLSDGQEFWFSHLSGTSVLGPQTAMSGALLGTQGNTGRVLGPTGIHVDITAPKEGGGFLTPQEVARQISATSLTALSSQQKRDLEDAFTSVIGVLPSERAKSVRDGMNRFIESGDFERAKDYLKSQVLGSFTGAQKSEVNGRDVAISALNTIEAELLKYQKAGGDTGIFKGNIEKVAQKVGKTTDPELAAIQNKILASVQTYRRALSGVAFTPAEAAEYQRIFPDIGKGEELNQTLIKSIRDTMIDAQRISMQNAIGKDVYNSLFDYTEQVLAESVSIEPTQKDIDYINSLNL